MATSITATTAGRRLSEILDAVEHEAREFLVERHGRTVARIGPAGTAVRVARWAEVIGILERLPRPDVHFGRDIALARRRSGRLPLDPWARSLTRRS